jgi:hypothetical protein
LFWIQRGKKSETNKIKTGPISGMRTLIYKLDPILDMERLIRNLMAPMNVSEERLKAEKVIKDSSGQVLD